MNDKPTITAYEVVERPMVLRAAHRTRGWIEGLPERFAYRCLPLTIVNQMGWEVLNPVAFTAKWNGRAGRDAISIRFHGSSSDASLVGSHFGHGVLTFTPGYLFRTSKGHNLWVKGPANMPKDGIAPLEGLVESDWAPFTFTMNWQFTRKRHKVTFEKDEPICTIAPYPRRYISGFQPEQKSIHDSPELFKQYVDWRETRLAFNAEAEHAGSDAGRAGWQRHYMKGQDQAGNVFAGHESKIHVKPFKPA